MEEGLNSSKKSDYLTFSQRVILLKVMSYFTTENDMARRRLETKNLPFEF